MVAFMAFVDVPMYVGRRREDEARRAPDSTVLSGLADARDRRVVTRR